MDAPAPGDGVTCARCGHGSPAGALFCPQCGAALAVAPTPREERKLVSILFVDLEGFTASADDADPEDVRDALTGYHAVARERIEAYGGTVEKFIGDAVMAVFGAPVAHSDDAERAVRAGLRVLEAVTELGTGLAARAAVNTGEAIVSVSRTEPGEALAIGDVVNTAARLQAAAPAGRLVVGIETRRATRHVIEYEPLPAVVAKGKAAPVETWLAIRAVGEPAERPGSSGRFVGRQRELELIRSVWRQATSDRRPHVVTVLGRPGSGSPASVGRSRPRSRRAAGACSAAGACRTRSRPATTPRPRWYGKRSGSSTPTHSPSHGRSSTRASGRAAARGGADTARTPGAPPRPRHR